MADKTLSFLDNLIETAGTRASRVKSTFENRDPYSTGISDTALSLLGETAGFVGDVTTEALSPFVPDFVKEGFNSLMSGTMNTAPAQAALKWAQENPKEYEQYANTFNILTLGKAGSLLKPDASNKGAWAAGQSNYINNFYGNDNAAIPATGLEQFAGKTALSAKGVPATEANVEMAGKKLSGMASWAAKAPANVLDAVLNPYSRALYKETGISRRGQELVKEFINDPNVPAREIEKGLAQVVYNRHIVEQAGREGTLGRPLLDVEEFANVQGYRPLTKEVFRAGAEKTKTTTTSNKKTRVVNTPEKDIDFAYGQIKNIWKIDADKNTKIIFKQPSGGASGSHVQDIARKNPANKHIRNAVVSMQGNKGKVSVEKLFNELQERSKSKDFRLVTTNLEDAKKNGVWVTSGFVGSAVVEGGVNTLMKVLPNGRVIAFLSDKHDFLDKLPVINKVLEKRLPNDLLAVAAPIHLDLMNTKYGKKALEKAGERGVSRLKPSTVKRETTKSARDILNEYTKARPSIAGVAGEAVRPFAGLGMLSASAPIPEQEE